MSEAPITLVTTRSDAEIANDLKQRINDAAKPLLALFDEAFAQGLAIQFDGIAMRMNYRHEIINLRIVKIY